MFNNIFFSRRMMVIFLLGIGSGVPLGAIYSTLQAWMTESGVDIKAIGLLSLVQIPYSFKFLWAPIMDRYVPPFLGRRRGWMLIAQIGLMLSLFGISLVDPKTNPWMIGLMAVIIAFFSASQDIVVDAYRRDLLPDEELGLGSSMAVNGYTIGFRYVATALALVLADHIAWASIYKILAALVLIGVTGTLLAPNPKGQITLPKSIGDAIITPLVDYFRRPGSLEIVLFILLYKLGDNLAVGLSTTFYKQMGFTNTEIGLISKTVGAWSIIFGGFIGGVILTRTTIRKGLLIFGVLQAMAILPFAILVQLGPNKIFFAFTVIIENMAAGMGSAAFAAFMSSLTNRKFSATQFALLSSLMSVPRTILSSPTGFLVSYFGWYQFFLFCMAMAIPGMLLLIFRGKKWELSSVGA